MPRFSSPVKAAVSLALGASLAQAATPAQWRSRSIYQVLTDRFALTNSSTSQSCNTGDQVYCGGSWQGIINNLGYIQGMGFDAVWISPITQQLVGQTPDGSSYHGYWQQDLYNVNSNFGSASDLKALSAALHKQGMYLMVDVVFNHFASWANPNSINYSQFDPFNEQSYFHQYCPINYSDTGNMTQIQDCWGGSTNVPLADLRTEDSDVASTFQDWIKNDIVPVYSVDGFRVDSALETNTGFWSGMETAAGVYMVGEVDNSDIGLVCSCQKYMDGVLNYGVYGPLIAAFQSTSGSMSGLANAINSVKSSCQDTSLLGTFSENHDVPRFAQLNSDINAAKNVLVFTLLTDGIPIVYEGQEQHYASLGGSGVPWNREAIWFSDYSTSAPLYQLTATLNLARKTAIAVAGSNLDAYLQYMAWPIYNDSSTIAVRKGTMILVLSNQGSNGGSYTLTFGSTLADGTPMTELLTCNALAVDGSGNLNVPMQSGLPRVYYPTANLTGSGLCGH